MYLCTAILQPANIHEQMKELKCTCMSFKKTKYYIGTMLVKNRKLDYDGENLIRKFQTNKVY